LRDGGKITLGNPAATAGNGEKSTPPAGVQAKTRPAQPK